MRFSTLLISLCSIRSGLHRMRAVNLLTMIGCIFSAATSMAVMPDVYDELGISPERVRPDFSSVDSIDPFTGQLTIVHTDVSIPGAGGMDLTLQRVYNHIRNLDDYTAPGNLGLGWTFHVGRVVSPPDRFCDAGTNWTYDNAAFESPDGRRQLLVLKPYKATIYLTRDRLWAECKIIDSNVVWTIKNQDGVTYTASQQDTTSDGNVAYYVTEVSDLRGNKIFFEYLRDDATGNPTNPDPTDRLFLSRITSTDGREVNFTYWNKSSLSTDGGVTADCPLLLLKTIESNWRVWAYDYEKTIDYYSYACPLEKLQLKSVTRPDGTKWAYTYYPEFYPGSSNPAEKGSYSMHTATTPLGGKIEYAYKFVRLGNEQIDTLVVRERATTTNRAESDDGIWSYTYDSGSTGNTTTITTKNSTGYVLKTQEYKFHSSFSVGDGTVWKVGLPMSIQTSGSSESELTVFEWDKQMISLERHKNLIRHAVQDSEFYAPILKVRTITRDKIGASAGSMYVTTFDNHDGYGNPLFVEETGPNFSQRSRTLSYYNDESDWIIGFVDTETISGDGLNGSFSIVNTYHPNWLIKSVNEFGKISGFIYHSTGDLWKSTDPAGNVTEYTNYHRGRARTINQPDIVPNITRVIDNNGNITSITNARNIETTYGFDEMDRLKFINFPSPRPGTSDPTISDVTISLTKTMANTQITGNKTSQGDLTVYEYWDGFGRVVRTKSIATDGTGEALYERYKYDVDGNMTFESQQSNTANPTIGVNYAYDALDRVTRRTEADGSFTKSSYLSDNIQIITDSRDYVTTQQFKSFGSPNEQYLTKSTTAITVYHDNGSTTTQNHVTDIERDAMGFVESITQGGVTHDFEYDERRLLLSETRPETGTTIYTRDNNDNILFKDISGLVVGYTYNGLNWLKNTNFPDGSIVRSYDNNGNLENISYKGVTRSFEFNQVDLVESVTLNITGGPSMTLGYDYNNRRDVNALTYPTGKVIELNPDDFGRTTTVGNYVGSVNYHPSGLLESFSYENGVTTTVTPHPREWVANIKTSNGPSETFVDLAYSYDGEGNTTSLTNAALSPPYSSTTTMSYDELNRLVHVNFPGEEIKNHYLTYDNAGNLLYKSNPREVIDYSYSTSNQLDSATLNWGTGNETVFSYQYTNPYGSVTDDGFSTYTYDDANFLTSVTGYTDIANQFDGDGRKFSMTKDGSTSYYLYSADKLLFEFNETENWLKEYYFLDNNLVAERKVIDLANFDSDNDGISDLSELGVSQ